MWVFLELLLIALVAAPIAWAWRQAVKNAQADRQVRENDERKSGS
ncbi:MAG TPA: hypothetical protein PKC59_06140 [Burkholderiaceae bacterium]|nr:hypothetical protein [Burkholderiaceae bacterium]HMX11626.1 hypothetical protein [Burkholderiaceae bacterium]HMY99201.1 hypothetical protein [Burkholderiaceae bacterium]HNB43930.1 hypothetical protein [Burkholderiaceae bacterium]HNG78795.1 hypothetical protein [Burkholderiaceae bacterium]